MDELIMGLDKIYKKLNECNITDDEQRRFIIDNRNILPAHEIETVLDYFSKGYNIDFVNRNLVPIMEHIEEDKTVTVEVQER